MTEMRYGDNKTIHRTGYVDVEVDKNGTVVSVWYRCHPVPFKQAEYTSDTRAEEMTRMYAQGKFPQIKAIVFDTGD